jgi:CheY-like chemotaxis protein
MPNLLCIDHGQAIKKAVFELFTPDWTCYFASEARSAISLANETTPDVVLIELSLASHSGLEFIYEFRTYADWRDIPIIVYTTIDLPPDVTNSLAWKKLGISRYLYKPKTSLKSVHQTADKLVSSSLVQ